MSVGWRIAWSQSVGVTESYAIERVPVETVVAPV